MDSFQWETMGGMGWKDEDDNVLAVGIYCKLQSAMGVVTI